MEKLRLDVLLVERGFCESREKAKRAIMAGQVLVMGQVTDKPSAEVATDAAIELKAEEKFVSRGGHKLEAALNHFKIRVTGAVCVDLGASTGGFTDCLLQHAAARVHAVDVGKGQIAYKLRRDPRVVVHDGVNARHLQRQQIGEAADIVVIDVAFIGLAKVLPAAKELLKPVRQTGMSASRPTPALPQEPGGGGSTSCDSGVIIALIKPQFEAGPKDVGKGGVVKDETVRQRVVDAVRTFATEEMDLRCDGVIESPLLGPAGNKEFLICLRR